MGAAATGVAIGRESGTAARAFSVTRGALEAGADGREAVAAGAGRALARGARAGAAGADCTGAVSVTRAGASETTASDCSTPPVATSDAGAAGCRGAPDGRLTRKAPAAPMVMHEAATTATVEVLISMDDLRSKACAPGFGRFRVNYRLISRGGAVLERGFVLLRGRACEDVRSPPDC